MDSYIYHTTRISMPILYIYMFNIRMGTHCMQRDVTVDSLLITFIILNVLEELTSKLH